MGFECLPQPPILLDNKKSDKLPNYERAVLIYEYVFFVMFYFCVCWSSSVDCSLQVSPWREVPTYLDQSEIKVSDASAAQGLGRKCTQLEHGIVK